MPRGPAAKKPEQRVSRKKPVHEWQSTNVSGWQHGDVPAPPDGLLQASLEAWNTWFAAWWSAFWAPDDLPGIQSMILLYDQVRRGEYQRHGELRLMMDTYGVTPKGRQDRRWRKPVAEEGADSVAGQRPSRYSGLRAVSE